MSEHFANRERKGGNTEPRKEVLLSVSRYRANGKSELELFSESISETVSTYSSECQMLTHDFGSITTVDAALFAPVRSASKLEKRMGRTIEEIEAIPPRSKIEELVLSNMSERLTSLRMRLNENQKEEFDYPQILSVIGVQEEDVVSIVKRYRAMNAQKIAERLLAGTEEHEAKRPESEEQAEKVKEYYMKFLKLSFEMADPKIKKLFPSFKSYMEKVNFFENDDGSSYEKTDTIFLNTYEQDTVVNIRKGDRLVAMVNPFMVADIVAEEGLLGHQGHFLLSENSDIPSFMKRDLEPSTNIHAETIVRLGKSKLVNKLKEDHGLARDLSEEDFLRLENQFETSKKIEGFQRFYVMYRDYVYFTSGSSIDAASRAIFDISGDPTFLTEAYKNRTEAYYKGKFWEEYGVRTSRWAYVVADELVSRFEEKLETLEPNAGEKVLEHLRLGYWPRKSLEKYFNHLAESVTA